MAVDVAGRVAAGFEPIADVFVENFERRSDTGAACAVYADGEPVVDIWAGLTDRGPWRPATRTCVFSVSKGVTTVCLLMAVERGLIALDAPVVKYWPEFGVGGKEWTTVRHLLSHRAGLPAPLADLTVDDVRAWYPAAEALAQQPPMWLAGSEYAYHALTVGWLVGEVLRRTTGMRPAEWLQVLVVEPLALDMAFGIDPADADFCPMLEPLPITDPEATAMDAVLADPGVTRTVSLGRFADPSDLFGFANTADWLQCELPAGNLVTNARSLARLYAATVSDVDGYRLLDPATVLDACAVQSQGPPFLGADEGHRWGTGFMLHSSRRQMAGDGSFGHDGAGGHLAFAHLESKVSFAYHTSRPGGIPDERAEALCAALRRCL